MNERGFRICHNCNTPYKYNVYTCPICNMPTVKLVNYPRSPFIHEVNFDLSFSEFVQTYKSSLISVFAVAVAWLVIFALTGSFDVNSYLIIVGFMEFFVFLIFLIIALIRRTRKAFYVIGMIASVILFTGISIRIILV